MPKYIDTHKTTPRTVEQLKKTHAAPKDKFGVTHHDVLYNKKESKIYCILDAPDMEAVKAHHKEAGIECEWIEEVETARD